MKNFNELTGFNGNSRVKFENDHVFVMGEGCFFETEELARKNNKKTGNEVGLYINTYIHEGREIYQELNSNVWN